jgi:hypothetical protein
MSLISIYEANLISRNSYEYRYLQRDRLRILNEKWDRWLSESRLEEELKNKEYRPLNYHNF